MARQVLPSHDPVARHDIQMHRTRLLGGQVNWKLENHMRWPAMIKKSADIDNDGIISEKEKLLWSNDAMRYDRNSDGIIDFDEAEAMRKEKTP